MYEIGQVVLEKIFKKQFFNVYFLFPQLSPLRKGHGPSFEQTWIPFTQGCIVPSLVEIGQVVLEKKIFKNFVNVFYYFIIISPWKRGRPFICRNLNFLHSKMLCAKFGWNGSVVLEKKVKSLQVYNNNNNNNNDRHQTNLIRKTHLSLPLRWAKNMTGQGMEPKTPSPFRCSTTQLSRPLSIVHLA